MAQFRPGKWIYVGRERWFSQTASSDRPAWLSGSPSWPGLDNSTWVDDGTNRLDHFTYKEHVLNPSSGLRLSAVQCMQRIKSRHRRQRTSQSSSRLWRFWWLVDWWYTCTVARLGRRWGCDLGKLVRPSHQLPTYLGFRMKSQKIKCRVCFDFSFVFRMNCQFMSSVFCGGN